MKRTIWLFGLFVGPLLTGCVERRFVIQSDPPGALVLRNGQPIGATPADDTFVYYGKYDFTLIKDGYETLHIKQDVPTPWYEIPPLDFFAENIWPFTVRDIRRFTYPLEPLRNRGSDEVLQRGQQLREQGQLLGREPRRKDEG